MRLFQAGPAPVINDRQVTAHEAVKVMTRHENFEDKIGQGEKLILGYQFGGGNAGRSMPKRGTCGFVDGVWESLGGNGNRRQSRAGAPLPTVEDWANQVDYVVKLVGAEHVGLGLDLLDGGNWLRDFDATSYSRLASALAAKGYSASTLRQILGENWLRMLDSAKVPQ